MNSSKNSELQKYKIPYTFNSLIQLTKLLWYNTDVTLMIPSILTTWNNSYMNLTDIQSGYYKLSKYSSRWGTGPANTWPEMSGACAAASTNYFLPLHFSHLHFAWWLLKNVCGEANVSHYKSVTDETNDCLLNPSPGLRLCFVYLLSAVHTRHCKIQSVVASFLILSKTKNTLTKVCVCSNVSCKMLISS